MRNFLDDPGFGDRAAAEGEAIEVPADVAARLRADEGRKFLDALHAQLGASVDEDRARAKAKAQADEWWTNREVLRAGVEMGLPSGERVALFVTFADGCRIPLDGPESEHGDSEPLWVALMIGTVVALFVTVLFGALALTHAGYWTVAEVTAPLWVTALTGAVFVIGMGVGCAVLDARDAHRRRQRRS